MPPNTTNPRIDRFLHRARQWQTETARLRNLILGLGLTEELKWGKPCYTFQKKNVLIIIGFKDSCALMFCKGALLKDPKRILLKPGENTQAGRWVKFNEVSQIDRLESTLKSYIQEAIQAEKAGLKVELKKTSDFKVPAEFQNKLKAVPGLRAAFKALTPGRQRAYLLHFSAPKQSQTRAGRIEKCLPLIMQGEGLNDDFNQRTAKPVKRLSHST